MTLRHFNNGENTLIVAHLLQFNHQVTSLNSSVKIVINQGRICSDITALTTKFQ